MAISKDSKRIQFTLNKNKEKEKIIIEFLDSCFYGNSTIKEILYNYIVTHCDTQLPQVTQTKVTQNDVKFLKVSNSDTVSNNEVSNYEKKLPQESSELEFNELEELKNFI